MRETFERWLADGQSWIGVFENKALDSGDVGKRVAFVYDIADMDKAEVGKLRAPDSNVGVGWKYILIAKATTVDQALALMSPEPFDWDAQREEAAKEGNPESSEFGWATTDPEV